MARKLKIMENEKHPFDDLKNDEITEKREIWEMHTVGPEYGEKTENHEKWEIHTLGREIYGEENWKKLVNLEMSTLGRGIWQEKWKSWKNEKHPLDDLKNDEITEKREK